MNIFEPLMENNILLIIKDSPKQLMENNILLLLVLTNFLNCNLN